MTIPSWLRQVVFLVAAVAFAITGALVLRKHPEILRETSPWPLLGAGALVPLMVTLNALEYRLSARFLGLDVQLRRAVEVTIVGSAANMLPLPGAMLVRATALARTGASARSGAMVTLVFAGAWISASCLYSGAFLWGAGYLRYGASLTGVGVATFVTFCILTRWKYRQPLKLCAVAFLIKLGVVICEALQLYACCRALRADITFADASAMQLSALAGSAFALVPAGLGVREGVGALLADVVGVGSARGFLGVALNRLVNMAMLIPVALLMSRTKPVSEHPERAR